MIIRKFQIILIIVVLLVHYSSVLAVSNEINITQEVIEEIEESVPSSFLPPQQVIDVIPPKIYDLLIGNITFHSAKIEWKTKEFALCQLFWGKTKEYEEGAISETTFLLSHKTQLINLLSETNYYFKISCRDRRGNESQTRSQRFTTLSLPDLLPPSNIRNFEAIPGDSQITLKWQNPPDPDFKAVRIMRSTDFYPQDPWQGELVYDDKGTSFVDTGLISGVRYYYTAFAYDFAGNFSSGATASAILQLKPPLPHEEITHEEITTEKECLEAGYYWYDDACHLEPKIVPPPLKVEKLILGDFDFFQEGQKIIPVEEKIKVKSGKPLTISIDYEKVPEVSKTIMVTLEKDKKFFSFLLRINQEKTAYLATLMPPEEVGIYPLTIAILDYENQVLKEIYGQLEVFEIKPLPVLIPWYKRIKIYYLCILLIFLILAIIIYFISKKIKIQKASLNM